jgi:hypothetical protein
LKLQFYYITEVDLGIYSDVYGIPLTKRGLTDDAAPPLFLLLRLSLDQNLIGKLRVLWERLMNLVYFVENQCELKESNNRSKKGKFFASVNSPAGEKWQFLAGFKDIIQGHDDTFRSAEFHTSSTLRKEILQRTIDPNDITRVGGLHYFLNGMWPNILSVMRGDGPVFLPVFDLTPKSPTD